jgi:hypothetical protein
MLIKKMLGIDGDEDEHPASKSALKLVSIAEFREPERLKGLT